MGAILIGVSYAIKRTGSAATVEEKEKEVASPPSAEEEDVKSLLEVDVMELEIVLISYHSLTQTKGEHF